MKTIKVTDPQYKFLKHRANKRAMREVIEELVTENKEKSNQFDWSQVATKEDIETIVRNALMEVSR